MKKEGEKVLQDEDPAAQDEDHGEAAVPLQTMEYYRDAEIPLQPMGDPTTEQNTLSNELENETAATFILLFRQKAQ
ncbi:hypothetical protein WISP_76176 [Willisornis vidua]|uniref:Uncharacterized protein n=1 Tax=Willisornis vidua TaxID=1566151 RepID=A0ABQ9D6P4_9PASS|nr:hypothetical protein WISP_76176 [Willisornis vidua]